MKLVGFTGAMGSGKSTAIECLSRVAKNQQIVNIKFAQPLYDMQEYIYKRIRGAHQREASFVKDRKLLQWLGTEWGRETISPSLWIEIWKSDILALRDMAAYNTIVTCDDIRYDNEAQAVRELGGIVVKVISDKNIDRITTANGISSHKSEQGVSDSLVSHYVNNNKTIEDLESIIFSIYKQI